MGYRLLIAVAGLLLCSGVVASEPVVVGHKDAKVAAAVTLHKASPTSVMWSLGLFGPDDFEAGTAAVWQRGKKPASAFLPDDLLSGLDVVTPFEAGSVLIVYGDKSAVERFGEIASSLDVVSRQVQVKVEIIKLTTDQVKSLGLDKGFGTNLTGTAAEDLRESLRKAGAEFVSSPVISTLQNQAASMATNSDSGATRLMVLPMINADGTITLTTGLSFSEPGTPPREQSLHTQRRLASGESVVLGGVTTHGSEPATEMIVVLTLRIVD